MELNEITPQILNRTYQKLEKSVKHQGTATCKPILPQILKEQGITRVAIHQKADIATNTVSNACLGRPIALESAEKIASALGRKTEELFEINKGTYLWHA